MLNNQIVQYLILGYLTHGNFGYILYTITFHLLISTEHDLLPLITINYHYQPLLTINHY